MSRDGRWPIAGALAAAALFGASTPAAKALGVDMNPFALAGLLYTERDRARGLAARGRCTDRSLIPLRSGASAVRRSSWPRHASHGQSTTT